MIAITLQRRELVTFIFGVLLCYSACNFVAVFVHYISNITGKHYSCQLYSFTIDRPVTTASTLLAKSVTTGIIPKNVSSTSEITACYSSANFTFNLTLIHCIN